MRSAVSSVCAWKVVEDDDLCEIQENVGTRLHPTWVRHFGTRTPDVKLLERICELHNQVIEDLGRGE